MHSSGKHKARLFLSKLGITLENQSILITKLSKLAANSTDFQLTSTDQYGDRYVPIFSMTTTVGTSQIMSSWIIRHGEFHPRLTSVYPILKRNYEYHANP